MVFSDKNISSNLIFSISGASPGSEAARVEIADPVPPWPGGQQIQILGPGFPGRGSVIVVSVRHVRV